MRFSETVRLILENTQSLDQIAQNFIKEYLSKFQTDHKGTYNCAWATQQFVQWAKGKGIDAKAIYMVWPDRPNGEAHIAPVVNNHIVDFTINQFDPKQGQYKITPLSKESILPVYGKWGYGENKVNIDGKSKSFIVADFDYLNSSPMLGQEAGKPGMSIVPAKLKQGANAVARGFKPPKLGKGMSALGGGAMGLASALNNELPASMQNDYTRSRGGYGISGKFVAEP